MIEQWAPSAPFDFVKMLQRPLSRPSKGIVINPENVSFMRTLRVGTRIVPIKVSGKGTVDAPLLRLETPEVHSELGRTEIGERVRKMLSSAVDLAGFYGRVSGDERWSTLVENLHGLRPIQDGDLFESMLKVIIGQQLNVQFAATLVDRLIDLGGDTTEFHGQLLTGFPTPERVASWSYDQLRSRSFSQRKAEYVIDFARAVTTGKVDLDGLRHKSDDEIHDQLTALRGIGRWTVECFLLFGMGRPDLMPAADIGVQNALRRLYDMAERPGEAEVRHLAQHWAPWRSYATYYLWQSLIPAKWE